ncbi:hypothetical protein [Pseudoalteromonas aliena]|uniref:Uncharacterized protein n=1 Tax=Pseudoalteromonas aliena SW19 TaxID=1314866 RepID=A0ABR9DYM8_9GAMM|nr:hypothetical protein [Pseudoalteromonas aliena]MBE0359397.1 hypothetical protein [Pseudoalteromonas aliena SW19]
MDTYLTKFLVEPRKSSSIYITAEKITAIGWLKSIESKEILPIAQFEIEKDGWKVLELLMPPTKVTEENFVDKDIGAEQFQKAQKFGRAFIYIAVDDRVSEVTVEELTDRDEVDIGSFHSSRNSLAKRGKCFHFNSGSECDSVINAHSVQKGQSLTVIAQDNHVYALADKVEKDGRILIKKKSIHKFSTFKGFCKYHDNLVFEPIDNYPLEPNPKQATLYAYRSICREVYVKENSLRLLSKQLSMFTEENRTKEFISDLKKGTENGLIPLLKKKKAFDSVLRNEEYQKIRYVVLECENHPNISFSGLLYPEFDFQGRVLQDISKIGTNFSLITFCSAPTKSGWAVIFSWHESDDYICSRFIDSIKEVLRSGKNVGDAIFRLVIATCENVAYSPVWWDSLCQHKKDELSKYIRFNADPWIPINSDYLVSGLSSIVSWDFTNVYSSY